MPNTEPSSSSSLSYIRSHVEDDIAHNGNRFAELIARELSSLLRLAIESPGDRLFMFQAVVVLAEVEQKHGICLHESKKAGGMFADLTSDEQEEVRAFLMGLLPSAEN